MPYAEAALPVEVRHADIGFQGRVQARQQVAAWSAGVDGDLQVNELQVQARRADDSRNDLLSWQTLQLSGLKLALAPGAKPRLEVREAELRDFYSRLVITEQGRFNLQDMAAATPADGAATAAAAASAAASAPAPGASDDYPVDLVLGGTRLVNGRVDFSDRFVKPNYSARLSELNGQIGLLRSGTR